MSYSFDGTWVKKWEIREDYNSPEFTFKATWKIDGLAWSIQQSKRKGDTNPRELAFLNDLEFNHIYTEQRENLAKKLIK